MIKIWCNALETRGFSNGEKLNKNIGFVLIMGQCEIFFPLL